MDRQIRSDIECIVEIISNSLYFAVLKTNGNRKLMSDERTFYFTIDDELLYQNYYCDFGPLNLSCLYKYCFRLNKYLDYAKGLKAVVHYTSNYQDKRANAAFLIGCFSVIYLKMRPKQVNQLLQAAGPYKSFLDASQFACPFALKLLDCFNAIEKARAFNFFDFDDFNASEYDLYNKLEYGDINWLVPRKFLAFIGPADNRTAHPPEFYIKYFLKNDVKTVIRLNNVLYDSYVFMQVGIQHYDLIFPDGSTPPKDILLKFLYIAESAPAAIAVHCKAGLGRTGSLIGAYLMKHYRMTAREAIGWMRVCRPGSVIGHQQIWLEKIQSWLWRIGSQFRLQHYGEGDKIPRHKFGIYSKLWPIERENSIRETRNSIQTNFTKSQISSFAQTQRKKKQSSSERLFGIATPTKEDNFKSIAQFLSSVHGLGETDRKPNRSIKTVNQESQKRLVKKKMLEKETQKSFTRVKGSGKFQPPTQGDKLNEIKAMRIAKLKFTRGENRKRT